MASVQVDRIARFLPRRDFRVLCYGSTSEVTPRDLDVLAIVRCGQDVEYHRIELVGERDVVCNLYVVPEPVWQQDVRELAYGGFYAHKVALSFSEVFTCGDVIDPAREFWAGEFTRFDAGRSGATPEILMRKVHAGILAVQPTFLRSLAKFARSQSRVRALVSWLSHHLESFPAAQRTSSSGVAAFTRNCERAAWLYWSEYEKHKGQGKTWSRRTIEKMRLCLDPGDIDCVEAYLEGLE